MRRVVSLYLPRWATDRLEKSRAAAGLATLPDGLPVLTAVRQGSRRLVAAVDAQGAVLGLHAGMAVAHAQAMVPGLHIEDARPDDDAAALQRLCAWCLRHVSPLAAPDAPDGIWIDITGCTHLFGTEAGLLGTLAARLAGAGIAVRAGLADTPGAAHALARHAADALAIAPPGQARAALDSLPVAALRIDAATARALRTLGFETIGQLMAAPRAPLAKRFGNAVLRRMDQASGAAFEPIEPMAAADLPRTRMGFPEPIATPEDLARATGLLCERLCEKLTRQGAGAARLDLVFQRVDGAHQTISVGTAAATRDAAHLARLLVARIETIDPGFGIEAICLTAPLTAPLAARQTLNALCGTAGTSDLAELVDVLANRLGADRVFRVAPVQSDVPERAVRRVPPLAPAEGLVWPDRLPRPPRLFTPPRPIDAMALLPDHAPASFTWRGRPHRIRHADGPERVFGEWWKTDAEMCSVRDYFAVEDDAGQRFWLFRSGDGEDGRTGDLRWFMHGVFG